MDIRADILLGRDVIQNWIIDGRRNCIILDNGFVVKMKNDNEMSVNVILEDEKFDLKPVERPFQELMDGSGELFSETGKSKLPPIEIELKNPDARAPRHALRNYHSKGDFRVYCIAIWNQTCLLGISSKDGGYIQRVITRMCVSLH